MPLGVLVLKLELALFLYRYRIAFSAPRPHKPPKHLGPWAHFYLGPSPVSTKVDHALAVWGFDPRNLDDAGNLLRYSLTARNARLEMRHRDVEAACMAALEETNRRDLE